MRAAPDQGRCSASTNAALAAPGSFVLSPARVGRISAVFGFVRIPTLLDLLRFAVRREKALPRPGWLEAAERREANNLTDHRIIVDNDVRLRVTSTPAHGGKAGARL